MTAFGAASYADDCFPLFAISTTISLTGGLPFGSFDELLIEPLRIISKIALLESADERLVIAGAAASIQLGCHQPSAFRILFSPISCCTYLVANNH